MNLIIKFCSARSNPKPHSSWFCPPESPLPPPPEAEGSGGLPAYSGRLARLLLLGSVVLIVDRPWHHQEYCPWGCFQCWTPSYWKNPTTNLVLSAKKQNVGCFGVVYSK